MKFRKCLSVLLILLTLCLFFGGCTKRTQTIAEYKVYTVVTSFYPIYISALNIAGNIQNIKVVNMTKPSTGCLHDYQLTTGDMKTLEKADVFVYNGAGMESFLDKVTGQLPDLKEINASHGIPLIKDSTGEPNPHVWVSVTNDIKQVQNIASGLAAADPAHAQSYRSNADAYIEKLQTLKTEMHNQLDTVKQRNIVTFHEAFPYFAQEFNLHIAAVIERDPGTSPTPSELQDTIKEVKKSDCKALFTEPQYPTSAAETISKETGARMYSLDPVVSGNNDPDAYITVMRQNLKTLSEALNDAA